VNAGSAGKCKESVCPTITLSPATLPSGTVGVTYSQTITASGSASSYTFALSSGILPAGLTLASGGALSGTPTAAGSSTFTVTATDAQGCTGSQSYTLTINKATPAFSNLSSPTITYGT